MPITTSDRSTASLLARVARGEGRTLRVTTVSGTAYYLGPRPDAQWDIVRVPRAGSESHEIGQVRSNSSDLTIGTWVTTGLHSVELMP